MVVTETYIKIESHRLSTLYLVVKERERQRQAESEAKEIEEKACCCVRKS